MLTVAIWVESFRCAGKFYFCNGKVKTLRIDNLWNFATFNLYTVRAEILYLQRYSTDCRNLCHSLEDVDGGHLGGKFQVRRYFTFAMARWNFAHRQHLKFCHFQPVHCASQNPISPKVFDRFLKIFELSSKMLRVGIWVVSFRGVGIFLLQWQGENLGHRQHFKFCHFQPVHGAGRNPISPKGFNRLSKSFLQLEEVDGGHLGGKFQVRRYLLLQWQGENFAHRQPLKFCHFQPVHCASRNPISPKIFNRLSKSLPQLEDVDGGHLGGKFQVRRYFTFAMARWNFAHRQHLKFCHFQPVHCASQNPISPKVFDRFLKSLTQLEDVEGGHLGGKFQGRRYFPFAMARWKLGASDNISNFATFNLYTVQAEILYLQRYSTDCRNLSFSSKMLTVAHLGGKFQVCRYFTFAMARWKLCASTTFEILPLSTCTLCEQKSYISKNIQPIVEIFPTARRCWRWPFGWKV